MELIIELCPERFLKKLPSGHFHTFILSLAPEAKVYSVGCTNNVLIDFLWFVNVFKHFPAAKSQVFICES
jgi:hypothetical protein